ncbi:hypothetical protein EPJ67_00035 [Brachyspira aalborgi]|uniref:Lipoprotein n=1 Tax=Brachyspira aalborgi TaxID=29522 RepID=A0A5C8GAN6_9SPIR|nr:hypothetical protein [Brachyspira aalborgi]TXJ58934.1 hypothetical protein EPJ67_00035 [Brachyspira aalborgi]
MIKRIIIIIAVSMLALACKSNTGSSGKPVTKNIPSVNKSTKEGSLPLNSSKTALFSMTASASSASTKSTTDIPTITPQQDTANNNAKPEEQKEYSVLTRLYQTVWFQTEEEQDDGRVETETTFLFFNENSEIEERELETGEPDESDYSKLDIVDIDLITSQDNDESRNKNACVVKNTEIVGNDKEFELYYLKDKNTLYVIELPEKYTKKEDLQKEAEKIIKELEENGTVKYNEDKYALSTI